VVKIGCEAQCNVELMWLTGRLMPDFKTTANFRKDNSKAIRGVCRQFVVLCQQLGLFGENVIATDGSKFKAVNNRDRNVTSAKLKTQMKERQVIEVQPKESPDKQVSLTDPDARAMMTRGTGIVGYNVQTVVDTQHQLIVAHEVTNVGSDRDQLSTMAKQAHEAIASETLLVVADRGYFKSEQIRACNDADITAYAPTPMTSGVKANGRFNNDAFIYDTTKNEYICPAGETLIWRYSNVEKGLKLHRYWSSNCQGCALKSQCTPSTERRVRRWEHEAILEEMQGRLSSAPEMMRIRKRTFEHPFGTLKQ